MEMTSCCTRVLDQGHPAAAIHYSKQRFCFYPQIQMNGRTVTQDISHPITDISETFNEATPDIWPMQRFKMQ